MFDSRDNCSSSCRNSKVGAPSYTLITTDTSRPTCNPSPFGSLVCRLEGTRANTVGLIDSAPVESFADCKQYCAVETDCLSFSTDSDNRCKLWSLKPEDRVAVRPGAGTFFFDRACETDAPTAPDALVRYCLLDSYHADF